MKLHVCCGDVYLHGYTNIDIVGTIVEGEIQGTDLENYYVKPLDLDSVRYKKKEQPIDMRVDILKPWPFYNNSVKKVVMIQAIEHFTDKEADYILGEIYRILEPWGKLLIDFPDIVGTVEQWHLGSISWLNMVRMIYGTWADGYAIHKYAYNSSSFYKLLNSNGRSWRSVEFKEVVPHDYPTLGAEAIK